MPWPNSVLLLMPLSDVPEYFVDLLPKLTAIQRWCNDQGTENGYDLCVDYLKSVSEYIDAVVVGVEHPLQLERIHQALREPLTSTVEWSEFRVDDERFIDPSRWVV